MRKLKIHNKTIPSPGVDKLLKAANRRIIEQSEQEFVLEEVRKGNAELIPRLIDSCEVMILSVARGHWNHGLSVNEMLDIGRRALTELAKREMHSHRRESFFRFGAWVIRQNILNINPKRNKFYKK